MKEAEAAYQEALDLRRQLAKASPATYQPDVAETLNNLAILELQTKNPLRAQADVEEALNINRELWKVNPAVLGDNLARSLMIDVMVLSSAQRPPSELFSLVREAESVSHDPKLKKAAADKETEFCV